MQLQRGLFMRVLKDMVDALCVEQGRAALDAMNLVALLKQEFGQIGSILSSDPGNQRLFHPNPLIPHPGRRRI